MVSILITLPSGYTLDTAASVPEPTALTLAVIGSLAFAGVRFAWRREFKHM